MAEHKWWIQSASFEEWLAGTAVGWRTVREPAVCFWRVLFMNWLQSTQRYFLKVPDLYNQFKWLLFRWIWSWGIYITCASVIVQHNFSTPADDFHAFPPLVLSLYIFCMIHLFCHIKPGLSPFPKWTCSSDCPLTSDLVSQAVRWC